MNISENSPSTRLFRRRAIVIIGVISIIGAALAIYAFLIEPDRLVVNRYEVKIANWDTRLDGLKIAALADIHGGANFIDEVKIRSVVETANAHNPDITVLLGDYVSQIGTKKGNSGRSLKMPMTAIARALRGLRAKHGVFAVLGNHDDWYDAAQVRKELENVGITVLDDEIFTINKNGSKIHLAGLRDLMRIGTPRQFHEDAKVLVARVPDGELIVLDHNPDVVEYMVGEAAIADNLRLVLAAHTHGGQVWLPLIGSPIVPSNYGQRYAFGHSVRQGVDVFVTTGIGTSIIPVRFLVPPEIALVTIKSK